MKNYERVAKSVVSVREAWEDLSWPSMMQKSGHGDTRTTHCEGGMYSYVPY